MRARDPAVERGGLKAKVSVTGAFVITGFSEMGAGWLEAVGAEPRDGVLVPVGRSSSVSAARTCGSGSTVARPARGPFRPPPGAA